MGGPVAADAELAYADTGAVLAAVPLVGALPPVTGAGAAVAPRVPAPPRPVPVAIKNPVYRHAGRAFGLGMRLVPRGYRFGVAVRLAGVLAPVLRRTGLHDGLRYLRVNSDRDLSLNLLLVCMTASGTPFDLALTIEGQELLDAAIASGRGTVIVAPHALLSLLILRHLYDRGHTPTIIGQKAGISLAGTSTVAPTLPNSPTVLVVVRSRLRAGGIVCA
ncbi:MAG TPA: hypothetical protein VFY65_20940, partial [Longimicrobium sp.]|nr:hypothetical protein [Longimicrobium sp.]